VSGGRPTTMLVARPAESASERRVWARYRPWLNGPLGRLGRYVWNVKPEAQWYLVEALSSARGQRGLRDDYEAKQNLLSHFAGVLAAFRYVGDVTQDEEHAWYRKMLVALGYEPPEPAPAGVSQAIYVGDPEKRPTPPPPENAPVFVRSHPGPDQEFEVHGGRLRIIAVEVYDVAVVLRWTASPEPDLSLAFPDEAAALESDLAGLEDWAADDLRRKGEHKFRTMRLYRFDLADDVGTEHLQHGRSHGGGGGVMSGEAEFRPAPPPTASALVLSWLDLQVELPLT